MLREVEASTVALRYSRRTTTITSGLTVIRPQDSESTLEVLGSVSASAISRQARLGFGYQTSVEIRIRGAVS
jgi:hypothetical protein